ncbi:hypothetical protein C5167_017422 [Papaver somniferum]|uniref:F-box associated beta-propeller type 1 domain-containing protein n=1 Tax=Papaver somniferum TaxID=3469 RepID=A0A4Y7INE1_PAPSO|nr:hypothetical protein C5167_017422 [Papaver somniferum]
MRIGEHRTSYGFGYDCNIKDYKLVRIVDLISHGSEVQVYTLGSNAWRSIANIPYNIAYQEPHGILVNTTLHWSARKSSTQLHSIISFHIESESFEEVPLLQAENFDDTHQISLCVSGRCLCILTHHHKVRTDVWVMKEYGVRHSWTKLFSITQQTVLDSFYLMPVLFIKNDVVLLDQNYHSGLLLYDPKHENDIIDFDLQMLRITPYVGCLVSLNSDDAQENKQEAAFMRSKDMVHMERRIWNTNPNHQASACPATQRTCHEKVDYWKRGYRIFAHPLGWLNFSCHPMETFDVQ